MSFELYPIDEQKEFNGNVFPLCLTASDKSKATLVELLTSTRSDIDNKLRIHGGILFRGFQLSSHDDFHDAVIASGYKGMDYIGGAAVRTQLTSRIFTANESPSSEVIPFHHEMAQTPHPPTHLWFFCEVPPSSGGQTPILISNVVYERMTALHPEFMSKIEALGVKYVRYLPEYDDPTSAIGRGWRSTFLCETREAAEEALVKLGSNWEWLPNGVLKTVTATLSAIRLDSGTNRPNRKTFFNSIVAAYAGWNDSRNVGHKAVLTSDNEELDPVAMNDAIRIMDEICVAFKWQQGDLLLLDNRTVMHARRPYEGPRRILASLVRDAER